MADGQPVYNIRAASESGVVSLLRDEAWDQIHAVSGTRSRALWQPLPVRITRAVPRDFLYCGSELACTDHAWKLLEPHVGHDVESLPLLDDRGETYHLLNVVSCLEALDPKESRFFRSPVDGSILNVLYYAFRPEIIAGHYLFRVPEGPRDIFATGAFKELCTRLDLRDTHFTPLPGPLWADVWEQVIRDVLPPKEES